MILVRKFNRNVLLHALLLMVQCKIPHWYVDIYVESRLSISFHSKSVFSQSEKTIFAVKKINPEKIIFISYSGRTEFQTASTNRSRRSVRFERRASQRYSRRPVFERSERRDSERGTWRQTETAQVKAATSNAQL